MAVSPVLIGRQTEFEALCGVLADGRAGIPRAAVIRGEAGIGKTRLVAEALRRLRADASAGEPPIVVATAQCVDGGDVAPPLHALRGLVRDLRDGVGEELLDAVAASPGAVRTLAVLVPELAGSLAPASPTSFEPSSDVVSDAIEMLVERLSETLHVVLVVEDIHGAAAVTAAYATMLATTLRGRHLTLLLTYRSDEMAGGTPFAGVVALEGRRTIEHLELGRLSADEVSGQIEAIAPGRFSRAATNAIAARSGGVPFLVEELVSLDGQELPAALRDLLLLRYRSAPARTRRLVELLSAGGDGIDHDIFVRVSGLKRTRFDAAVQDAVDRGMVITSATGYAFRHALLREAVYREMLPGVRRDAHGSYADALEGRAGDSFSALAAVADHRAMAGDRAGAFDTAVRCLSRPGAELDPATCARLWRRVADFWDDVSVAQRATSGVSRMEALRRAGEALWHAGDYDEALAVIAAALALPGEGDPVERAETLWWLVMCEGWITGRADEAALTEAQALLDGHEEPAARAQLARVRSVLGRHDVAALQDAVTIAREAQDPQTLAICLTDLAARLLHDGAQDRAATAGREALAVASGPAERHRARLVLANMLFFEGRYEDAAEIQAVMLKEAVDAGRERGHGAVAMVILAQTLLYLGRSDDSAAHARRALQMLVVPFDRSAALRILAEGDVWGDRLDAYADKRRVIRDEMPDVLDVPDEDVGWRRLDLLAGLVRIADQSDPRRRLELLRDGLELEFRLRGAETQPWVRPWTLPLKAWLVAEGYAVRGIDPDVDRRVDLLRDEVEVMLTPPTPGIAPALAAYAAAELAADGDPALRLAAWRAALAAARGGDGLPVQFVHRATLCLAGALIASADRVGAEAILAELGVVAAGAGDALVARWAEQLATRVGLVVDPRARIASLTDRESQVLELVARGMTNPQIGRELFISPKTVSIHVSSMLAKLGVANRTEAAAFARARADGASRDA